MIKRKYQGLKRAFKLGVVLKRPRYFNYFLWATVFFLLYFTIWPLVWHLIILPAARPEKHQLRVESYAPYRVDNTFLFLDRPDTSLTAYAVWQVPKEGLYHIKLSCDDNGKVLIDNYPVITLIGISPRNVGENKQWLTPGPHFLELRLNNILDQGWLKIEVAEPDQADYRPLSINELSFLERGNIEDWLNIVSYVKFFCHLGFLGLMLKWIVVFFRLRKLYHGPLVMQDNILKKNSIDFYLFLLLSLIFSFYWTQLRFDLNPDCNIATLIDLTNGNACIPFQYRILVPLMVYLISEKSGFNYINTIYFYKFFEFISIYSLVLAYRHYLTFLFNSKTAIYFFTFSLFVPLTFTFLVPAFCFFPSDIPSILFFTLGLIFLYKKNWIAYYLIFAIGTFNRETTCFLTMICIFVFFDKEKLRDLTIHGLLQILIWISIKLLLYHLFITNLGDGFIETKHLQQNIVFLKHLSNYPLLFSGGVLFVGLPTLVFSGLIKNEFIRKSIWVSIPFVIGMIFVGFISELRIYGELIPVLFPAFLLILKELFTKDITG